MLAIGVAMGGVVSPVSAQQYDKVFRYAGQDHNWGTSGNWQPPDPPEASDSVQIPSGESCLIAPAGSDAVAELVDVAGTLTIDSGRKLTVTAASAVKAGGLLEINYGGTLTTGAELTIEGASSGSAGHLRLHQLSQSTAVINGSGGYITVEAGAVPGLLDGSGIVEIPVYNSGIVQGGGDFPNNVGPLSFTAAVDGSTGCEFRSTYGAYLKFNAGISGGGTWSAPECDDEGAHGGNGFWILSASCVSADISVPYGGLSFDDDFCTTGTLSVGSDDTECNFGMAAVAGKTVQFHVSECPAALCP